MPASAYRGRRRPARYEQTQERIMAAVRELLAEGSFHEAPMEAIAARAGVSRATLYQHFRSRLELVDTICDTFAVNPALVELRETVELPDPQEALRETIARAVRFWASEDPVLSQLYGVAAIDPAAKDLVDRQRADRLGEMERLAHHLRRVHRLRQGTGERQALQLLMVLSSYETFRELREAGLEEAEIVRVLRRSAETLLLS